MILIQDNERDELARLLKHVERCASGPDGDSTCGECDGDRDGQHTPRCAAGLKRPQPTSDADLIDEFQRRFQNTTPVRARDSLMRGATFNAGYLLRGVVG